MCWRFVRICIGRQRVKRCSLSVSPLCLTLLALLGRRLSHVEEVLGGYFRTPVAAVLIRRV